MDDKNDWAKAVTDCVIIIGVCFIMFTMVKCGADDVAGQRELERLKIEMQKEATP